MIKIKSFGLISVGVLLYTILLTCFDSTFNNSSIATLLCFFSICLYCIGVFKYGKLVLPFTNNLDRLFFWFYIFWSVVTLIRGVFQESVPFGMVVKHRYLFTGFLVPMVVFVGIDKLKLRWVFHFSFISALVGIGCFIIKFNEIIDFHLAVFSFGYNEYLNNLGQLPGYFAIPAGLILLTNYNQKNYYVFVSVLYIAGIFTAMVFARRSFVAYYVIIILMSLYNFYFFNRKSLTIKAVFFLFIITGIIYLFSFIDADTFKLLFERFSEDSRSGVEENFYESMKFGNWIFGKGVLGQYYSPILDYQYRYVIETGYLQFILKGGVLLLFPYLYFLVKSFVLGFFYSNNLIIKGMALYSLFFFVSLYPGGFPLFDFRWILLWVCFLFCNSKTWRKMDNEEISNVIR